MLTAGCVLITSSTSPGRRGRGWSAHQWGGALPHRSDLDALFPEQPVVLQSHDMHSLWLNSTALQTAGITGSTPDPDGGRIVRDGAGEPTGLLLETAAELVLAHLSAPTAEEAMAAVLDGQAELDWAIEDTATATRRFARRQLTWFRADPRVTWFDPTESHLLDRVLAHLGGQVPPRLAP